MVSTLYFTSSSFFVSNKTFTVLDYNFRVLFTPLYESIQYMPFFTSEWIRSTTLHTSCFERNRYTSVKKIPTIVHVCIFMLVNLPSIDQFLKAHCLLIDTYTFSASQLWFIVLRVQDNWPQTNWPRTNWPPTKANVSEFAVILRRLVVLVRSFTCD